VRLLLVPSVAPAVLAVFIKLLQRFVTMYKVNIGGFTKFHPFDALMVHLCVLILGYISAV
jgi:hypothetical protein